MKCNFGKTRVYHFYADLVIDSNANIEENIQMIISKLKEKT